MCVCVCVFSFNFHNNSKRQVPFIVYFTKKETGAQRE